MKRKLIIFARKSEATETLKILKAKPLSSSVAPIWAEGNIRTCYLFKGGLVVIANVGIFSAIMAVARHVDQVDEIWNIGIAGALHKNLSIGSLMEFAPCTS